MGSYLKCNGCGYWWIIISIINISLGIRLSYYLRIFRNVMLVVWFGDKYESRRYSRSVVLRIDVFRGRKLDCLLLRRMLGSVIGMMIIVNNYRRKSIN